MSLFDERLRPSPDMLLVLESTIGAAGGCAGRVGMSSIEWQNGRDDSRFYISFIGLSADPYIVFTEIHNIRDMIVQRYSVMRLDNSLHRRRILTRSTEYPLEVYGVRRSRRRELSARTRQLIHAMIWLAGAGGFLIPLLMARTSPHADLLWTIALVWLIAFGVLNAVFVVRAFRHAPDRPRGQDSPFKR
ncbi:MAG: hypothetical protein ACXU82_13925 [Caulobacteraceae bacterium]